MTLHGGIWSGVDFISDDDSIDFIFDAESPFFGAQNSSEDLSYNHPNFPPESVPEVALQENTMLQNGFNQFESVPSIETISPECLTLQPSHNSEVSVSKTGCSDGSSGSSENFIDVSHGKLEPSSQTSYTVHDYKANLNDLMPSVLEHNPLFRRAQASPSAHNCNDVQYFDTIELRSTSECANEGEYQSKTLGSDGNTTLETPSVNFRQPFLCDTAMKIRRAPGNLSSCSFMEISLMDKNSLLHHANDTQYEIYQVFDGMDGTNNQSSNTEYCMGNNDNQMPDLQYFQSLNNHERTTIKDETGVILTDDTLKHVRTCYMQELSAWEYFSEIGDDYNIDNMLSNSQNSSSADCGVMDKNTSENLSTHSSCIHSGKNAICINTEEYNEILPEMLTCQSIIKDEDVITKVSNDFDSSIILQDSKLPVPYIPLPISLKNHAVHSDVKIENSFGVSRESCHSRIQNKPASIISVDEMLNKSASWKSLHDSQLSTSCKQLECITDEEECMKNQPNDMDSHKLKSSSKSIESNSLDNKSFVDEDSDICILDDISHPARPTTYKYRPTLAEPPRHIGVGSSRLKPNDAELIFRVALQDLSQPKSETSPPDGVLAVPLLRHQRIALSWMIQKETSSLNCCGGILADDQGLGKTISTIALILQLRPPSSKVSQKDVQQGEQETLNLDEDEDEDVTIDNGIPKSRGISIRRPMKCSSSFVQTGRPSAGTLVVCPTSVLRQWAEELQNKVTSKAGLSVLVYHGGNRTKDPCELAKYDVVITTYSIVSMEVPKQSLGDSDDDDKGSPETDPYGISRKRKYPPSCDNRCSKSKKRMNSVSVEHSARPLAKVAWFRVVLDEAQSIKNHRTQAARACWGLRAKRRWCLSGTPIQNAVDDLYSYLRFLKFEPYSTYATFCSTLKIPISRNPGKGYKKLQAVLKTIMLRRTKCMLLDGEPLINLPPKSVELKRINFSKEERDFYTILEAESRAQFAMYAAAGTVKQNYVNILLMLLRLRQACNHPLLVNGYDSYSVWKSSLESAKKLQPTKLNYLLSCLEASLAICGICNDPPEDSVVSICGHVFCNQCICEHLTSNENHCPAANCKVQLNVSSVFSKATLNICLSDESSQALDSSISEVIEAVSSSSAGSFSESSKIRAAIEVLKSLPKPQNSRLRNHSFRSDVTSKSSEKLVDSHAEELHKCSSLNDTVCVAGEKAIVFSQWTRMLDLLEGCLKSSSIQYRRLDGTMSVVARDKAVKDFNTVSEVSVIIMSLKAASLGLNMVAACHVILLDLWWNPTTEDQAIDRAHRIGQTRPVKVVRLTVKNTVEDRILALQQKKREMVASAFGEDEMGSRESRLTVEDLEYLFRS